MVKCKECNKRAVYGNSDVGPVACSDHRENAAYELGPIRNMVQKSCEAPGCSQRAIFANPETGKKVFCGDHKQYYMKNANRKKCPECGEYASYGYEVYKPLFCRLHAAYDMLPVNNKRCTSQGCQTLASFSDDKCKRHTQTNDNIKLRKCEFCPTRPSFNYEFEKPLRCRLHKEPGMINTLKNGYIRRK